MSTGADTGRSTGRADDVLQYRGNVPLWRRLSYPTRRRIRRGLLYILIACVAAIVLFPVLWIVTSALRPTGEVITRNPSLVPSTLTLQNLEDLFFISRFPIYLRNTIIVTTGVVLLTTTFATLGGYGLTRIQMPFKRTFARGVLFSYMFPPVLLAIPMYILWSQLGIINTYI